MEHPHPYNIQDFGPNDLLTNDRIGLRRVKSASEDSRFAAACNGLLFSICAEHDIDAGNSIAVNLNFASDAIIHSVSTYITGRTGDGLAITVDFNAVPTDAGATYIEVWIDIGGSVGQLYKRIITFPKGVGNLRPINFTVIGYTLDTWEANGGRVYVRSNGTADLYGMRYVLTSTHRAF